VFKLASLFVEIKAQDSALQTQIGGLQKQLSAVGVAVGTAAGNLAASAISSAVSALTGFFRQGIVGAANLGESISKVEAVFGESASVIKDNADQLAKAFGLPKQPLLDAGAAIGLVAKAAGQSQAASAQMGAQMAKLAADASSFYNVPLEDALQKIRSGLVGEAEPLRAFGVLLSEEAVAAEAVALGLAKSTKEVDNQAKVMARASLITTGLADASGDLERTQNSTANQWRKFQGTIENLAVSVGEALTPAMNELITLMNDMGQAIVSGVGTGKGAFQSFAGGIKEAIGTVGIVFRNFDDLWQISVLKATEGAANVIAVFDAIGTNISNIAAYIGRNWYQLLTDALSATATAFLNFGENLKSLASAVWEWLQNPAGGFQFDWKPLLTGFEATAEKLPELVKPAWVSMEDDINAIGDRIAQRESQRAQRLAASQNAIQKAGQKTAAAAATREKDFRSETVDTADFTLRLRASIFGSDDTQSKQLAAQQQIAENTKKIADQTGKPGLAVLG
jgi:hypothetical protein